MNSIHKGVGFNNRRFCQVFLLPVLIAGIVLGVPPEQQVTKKEGLTVQENGKEDGAEFEDSVPFEVESIGGGKVRIHSKTFTPPDAHVQAV